MSEKDKKFLSSIPPYNTGRTTPLPKEEFSDIKKEFDEGLKRRAFVEGLGGERSDQGESLTNVIVKASIEDRSKLVEQMNDDAARLRNEILQAQKTQQEITNNFLTVSLERIKDQQQHLEESRNAAMGAGAGPDKFQMYKEVKGLLNEFIEELGLKPTGSTAASDGAISLRLEEMRNGFTLKLEELKQLQRDADRRWEMDMKKWDREYGLKEREFEHSRGFQERAFDELTDLVQSLGNSITVERTGQPVGANAPRPAAPPAPSSPDTITPEVAGFSCSKCGAFVPVPEDYPETLKCPEDGCGMVYRLKKPAAVPAGGGK